MCTVAVLQIDEEFYLNPALREGEAEYLAQFKAALQAPSCSPWSTYTTHHTPHSSPL